MGHYRFPLDFLLIPDVATGFFQATVWSIQCTIRPHFLVCCSTTFLLESGWKCRFPYGFQKKTQDTKTVLVGDDGETPRLTRAIWNKESYKDVAWEWKKSAPLWDETMAEHKRTGRKGWCILSWNKSASKKVLAQKNGVHCVLLFLQEVKNLAKVSFGQRRETEERAASKRET